MSSVLEEQHFDIRFNPQAAFGYYLTRNLLPPIKDIKDMRVLRRTFISTSLYREITLEAVKRIDWTPSILLLLFA